MNNKINQNKTNNIQFSAAKPKIKEVKTMETQFKKLIKDVLIRAEREVPEYGDFKPVFEEFKNTDKALEATNFMLRIVKPSKNIQGHEKIRNIELVAYKLPLPYKAERIVATGSKDDILKALGTPEFTQKIEDAAKSLSKSLSDI